MISIISHPDCALHQAGPQHPEQPNRIKVIQTACKNYAFQSPVEFLEAPLATREQLIHAHDPDYVDWLISQAPQEGLVMIDADTWMNPYTMSAAKRAAGAVTLAVDLVLSNKTLAAFCNIRPPGHHAECD